MICNGLTGRGGTSQRFMGRGQNPQVGTGEILIRHKGDKKIVLSVIRH